MTKQIPVRKLKQMVLSLLEDKNAPAKLSQLLEYPLNKVVNPLFTALLSPNPIVKWHGVTAFGVVVGEMANQNLESARIIMRRFMWMLNDESGGIGWGVPEAMGEIMAVCPKLAAEYHTILISYLQEHEKGKDNFLEYAPLRRGAFWGVARLAQTHPSLAQKALPKIKKAFFIEKDAYILAYSLLYLMQLGSNSKKINLASLDLSKCCKNAQNLIIYWREKFINTCLKQLASQLLQLQSNLTQQGG
ncbi:MAG: HEAT repeat domain-containing protein [Desulfonauticus sp.]|nr:HEAT repeat domain-containing protein [Desulfonauticus sp.]